MNEGKESSSTPSLPKDKQKQNNRNKPPPHWKKNNKNNKKNNSNNKKPNNANKKNEGTKSSYLSSNNNHSRFIDVYTSDFQAMHERCLKRGMALPIKYKIHKPKTPALHAKLKQGTLRCVDDKNNVDNGDGDASKSNKKQIDVPINSNNIPDGMIVRPDSKGLPFFFLGTNTTLAEFQRKPRETERKLLNQMEASFQNTTTTTTTTTFSSSNIGDAVDSSSGGGTVDDDDLTREMAALSVATPLPTINDPTIIKFACAADLLADEPNGFACVASCSSNTIEKVRDWTRQQALNTSRDEKATDHGDFVVCLSKELLWEFLQATKKNKPAAANQKQQIRSLSQVQQEILSLMADQGVVPRTIMEPKEDEEEEEAGPPPTKLKFGHHLESLLYLVMDNDNNNQKKKSNKTNGPNKTNWRNRSPPPNSSSSGDSSSSSNNNNDNNNDYDYMLIYGFDDSTPLEAQLELNIPGGKRSLGETSLEAAMRETAEEISLQWDSEWICQIYQNKKHPYEKINRYYMLHPPPNHPLLLK